jgi:hypothetical protein
MESCGVQMKAYDGRRELDPLLAGAGEDPRTAWHAFARFATTPVEPETIERSGRVHRIVVDRLRFETTRNANEPGRALIVDLSRDWFVQEGCLSTLEATV